jgi:hypothetical protein
MGSTGPGRPGHLGQGVGFLAGTAKIVGELRAPLAFAEKARCESAVEGARWRPGVPGDGHVARPGDGHVARPIVDEIIAVRRTGYVADQPGDSDAPYPAKGRDIAAIIRR